MSEQLQKVLTSLVLPLLVLGALVDLMQFVWLMKRSWFRWRRGLYHKVERQVLENQAKAARKKARS